MGAEARIRVFLDGGSEAARELEKVRNGVEKVRGSVEKTGGSTGLDRMVGDFRMIQGSLQGVVASADRAGKAVLGITDVDITGAKARFRELDDSIARLAVTGNRSVASLKAEFKALAAARGMTEKELVQSATNVQRQTFNPQFSKDVQGVLSEEHRRTGASLEDLGNFAGYSYNMLGVRSPEGMQRLLSKTRELAQATQFRGGAPALRAVIANTNLQHAAVGTEAERDQTLAAIALVGRGLDVPQASEASNATVGAVSELDPATIRRTFGTEGSRGALDFAQRRRVPLLLQRYQDKLRGKSPSQQMGYLQKDFGPQALGAAAALQRIDTRAIVPLAEGRSIAAGVVPGVDLGTEEGRYDAGNLAQQNTPERRLRYDETGSFERKRQDALDENFLTNEVGGNAQRANDAFRRGMSPAQRLMMAPLLGAVPGATAGAAAISLAKDGYDADRAPAPKERTLDPGLIERAVQRGAREGVRDGTAGAVKARQQAEERSERARGAARVGNPTRN